MHTYYYTVRINGENDYRFGEWGISRFSLQAPKMHRFTLRTTDDELIGMLSIDSPIL
jgi:hypothetical protein